MFSLFFVLPLWKSVDPGCVGTGGHVAKAGSDQHGKLTDRHTAYCLFAGNMDLALSTRGMSTDEFFFKRRLTPRDEGGRGTPRPDSARGVSPRLDSGRGTPRLDSARGIRGIDITRKRVPSLTAEENKLSFVSLSSLPRSFSVQAGPQRATVVSPSPHSHSCDGLNTPRPTSPRKRSIDLMPASRDHLHVSFQRVKGVYDFLLIGLLPQLLGAPGYSTPGAGRRFNHHGLEYVQGLLVITGWLSSAAFVDVPWHEHMTKKVGWICVPVTASLVD